jgi:ubiquinone/menaquinone biosynthesis C-methylase UbiE
MQRSPAEALTLGVRTMNDEDGGNLWDAFSDDYDRGFGDAFSAIAEEALRFADIQPGVRLLDVAAGTGALSLPAARLGADVLATDLSAGMLDVLRRRAEEAGVPNVRTAVMDGMSLEIEDQRFDRVCSQFGVMLFPDTDAGLREMYRVTAVDGLGVMVIFGTPERVVPVWLFGRAIRTAVPDVEVPEGSPLQVDPMSLQEAMATAGYAETRIETLDLAVPVGPPDQAWDAMSRSAPGLALFLRQLSDEQVGLARETFIGSIEAEYGPDVTELPVEVVVGIGRRP